MTATALIVCCLGAASTSPTPSGYLEYRRLSVEALRERAEHVHGIERGRLLLILAQKLTPIAFDDATAALDAAERYFTPGIVSNESILANSLRCQLAYRRGQIEAAAQPCAAMEAHADRATDTIVSALVAYTRAYLLMRQGQPAESLVASKTLASLASTAGDTGLMALAYNAQGVALMESGLPENALEQYDRAWRHASSLEDTEFVRVLNFNIAVCHLEAGQFEAALEIFAEALAWVRTTGNAGRELIVRTMMARAHLGLDNSSASIAVLEQPLRELEDLADPDSVLGATATLADAYLATGDTARTTQVLEAALQSADEQANDLRHRQLQLLYARALTAGGRAADALPLLEQQLHSLRAGEPTLDLQQTLSALAEAAAALGAHDQTREAQREALDVERTLQSDNYARRLAALQAALGVELREQELSAARERVNAVQLRAERDAARRNALIAIAILGVLLGMALLSWRFQRRLARERMRNEEKLRDLLARRTSALREETQERHRLEETLTEREQLRILGQLTSGVAHDFNNLMNVVMLCADTLKTGRPCLTNEQSQCVDDIIATAESGGEITQALLAYARKQSLDPDMIDLHEFIEETRPILRRTLGERIKLAIAAEHCVILADRAHLTTALINLMLNARESVRNGNGSVTLSVKATPDRGFARIAVSDNGCGMTAEQCKRATEPFYTTKAAGQGSGLGLSIVYGFARQSDGDLQIDSSPGIGTIVTLTLPLAQPMQEAEDPAEELRYDIPPGTRVLVVEDQAPVRRALCRSLQALGCQTSEAASGDDARRKLDAGWNGDLIVSDILMPGSMSGTGLAAYTRERWPDLPVLLVSGYAEARRDDNVPFMRKPFSLRQLRETVSTLLQTVTPNRPRPAECGNG